MVEVANPFVERNDSRHPIFAVFGEKDKGGSKALNKQQLKRILGIRVFDFFFEREEFYFLYFSSSIYVRHTLKESSFSGTKGLVFLVKRHSKCLNSYCWNCEEFYHQGVKVFPNVDNFKKFIFSLVHCYFIPFSVKISHVMISILTNFIFTDIHHEFPQR